MRIAITIMLVINADSKKTIFDDTGEILLSINTDKNKYINKSTNPKGTKKA